MTVVRSRPAARWVSSASAVLPPTSASIGRTAARRSSMVPLAAVLSGASANTTDSVVSSPSGVRSAPSSTRATPLTAAAAVRTSAARSVPVTTFAGSEAPEG